MLSFIKNIFSGLNLLPIVTSINTLELDIQKLSDEEIKAKTTLFKEELKKGKTLDDILPEVFALVREAARRTLRQRHFDVQLMGGIVLHRGGVAEMITGEGKTLAATSPVYLNALLERGAHVVTVNEYLAKRDTVLMGQIYYALGMKIACLVHEGALMYDPTHTRTTQTYADSTRTNAEKNSKRESVSSPQESALLDKERDTTGTFIVQEEYLRPITRREA